MIAILETPQVAFETYEFNAKQQKLGNFGNYIGYLVDMLLNKHMFVINLTYDRRIPQISLHALLTTAGSQPTFSETLSITLTPTARYICKPE